MKVGEILYRIKEHPLLKNVNKSDVVNHIKTVIELVGAPGLYEEKLVKLDIRDYRAVLPKDFKSIVAVRTLDGVKTPMKRNLDDFKKFNKDTANGDTTLSYHIVNNYIYVDFIEGFIEIVYLAYKLDEDGLPILPDNESLYLAIENYIKVRYFGILADLYPGRYDRPLQRAEQQYAWYIAQATSSFTNPDYDTAKAIGDMIVRMLPIKKKEETNFKYANQREDYNRSVNG